MSDVALADSMSLSQLAKALDELAPHLEYLWLERPDGVELTKFATPAPLEQFAAGRGIGTTCDVRWLRSGDHARVMLVTAGPRPAYSFAHQLDLETDVVIERTSYLLWGVRDKGDEGWSEPRIPRLLSYPIAESAKRVLLDVILYASSTDGALVASRYTGLRGDSS